MFKNKIAILSLGGSLIVPNAIDITFLKAFKRFIDIQVKKGWRFIIVTGGGATSRKYQQAAGSIVKHSDEDLDWLGIHATKLNAHLIRSLFRKSAHPTLSKNPELKIKTNRPIIVATGWKPGWSTDYVSVKMCETYGISSVINLSNVAYAYTKDPRKYKSAKRLTDSNWNEFQAIVGTKWKPGANLPFDPIASKFAKKMGVHVFIVSGNDLKNIEMLLNKTSFKGTHIHP